MGLAFPFTRNTGIETANESVNKDPLFTKIAYLPNCLFIAINDHFVQKLIC